MTAIGRFTFTWSSGLNEVGPAVKSSLSNLLNSAERAAPSNDLARSAASLKASIVEAPVIRPCDANEVSVSWLKILEDRKPAGIVLTRQNIPTLDRNIYASAQNVKQGGYVLLDAPDANPEVILIATGSEVHLALDAQKELNSQKIGTRVVSMPCVEWFLAQPSSYQEKVLPKNVTVKIAVEAGSTLRTFT